jgi:hypothetical protein
MADINDDTLNTTLYDENGNAVSVIQDGSLYRLAIDGDVTISGDESPTLYQDRYHKDIPGQVVTTAADVTLFSFTGSPGLLDFIAVSSGNANYEMSLKIDGVEVWRFSMDDLGDVGLSNATNVPVWAENANKNFRYRPFSGSGFSNSFEVLGRATVGTQTLAHIVMYREKV